MALPPPWTNLVDGLPSDGDTIWTRLAWQGYPFQAVWSLTDQTFITNGTTAQEDGTGAVGLIVPWYACPMWREI
jgi:hypothetical protein